MTPPLLRPPLLKPGDAVAVVAPSSCIDPGAFERGVAILQRRYLVRLRPDIAARHHGRAGRDDRRLHELRQAIDDPAIRAIFCARGGYGATRLLDRLDTAALRAGPKWLIGYSDTTALHARWAREGVQSIHGPHVCALSDLSAGEQTALFDAIERDEVPPAFAPLAVLRPGDAAGPLLGGNLALLAAMCGTADFPPLDGAVLLLEDVDEPAYRVDRMLTQLRRAGVFDRAAAVVLGRFARCESDPDAGLTIDGVLRERLQDLSCPVFAGLPVGHAGPNAPLRLGEVVRVSGDRLIVLRD